ncbi:histidine kinase [Anoxybacillus gonensis]|uniref:histidine kinase n=1 Tax=Anoxybacillus gonensis TaxID=198467 RepID=A0AAW7THS1_9BACL|nr:ATP-binding protein [Anoxybacillus gonensis]AKS37859.1 histidine kinase [Anoxybacillus gonensis]KGP61843.1 histidine kinase [Anoxybacillus gonensis]MCX8046360.1 ATP-binding protein [Anoxybacillus gonensis]MDO0877570.1 ATP-binding protein [Anoxybacillus gonensis]
MEKMRNYFRQSLARQFVVLVTSFLVVFVIGAASLFLYQTSLTSTFEQKKEQIETKMKYAQEIERAFNQAFSDARGYLAFNRKEFKLSIFREQENAQTALDALELAATTKDDTQFLLKARQFASYYFGTLVPQAIEAFENGNMQKVLSLSENGGTASIEQFQFQMKTYKNKLTEQLDAEFQQLRNDQTTAQTAFILFIFTILTILITIARMMMRKIGKPLNELAKVAEKIANDEQVIYDVREATNREDEIGKLANAFNKMLASIQEKEESLMAHNEELLAQQDELEVQQAELEQALETMQAREKELKRHNEFVHGLSSSLDKQDVLQSIVFHMARIMEADRGVIVLMNDEKTHAAFGLSAHGVEQFLTYIYNGLHQRLFEQKKPFMLKREVSASEKGYHEETMFVHDIFLPVLSNENEVEAILVFSRFGGPFSDEEMQEYVGLTKQISISLQKIALYEQSEQARETVQHILNTVQEGIHFVDKNGNSKIVNKQMVALLQKQSIAELEGASYEQWARGLVEQSDAGKTLCDYLQSIIFNGDEEREPFVYHLPQKRKVIQVYAKPLYRNGERQGTVFVHRDITKEFEVDQMKSEFVSTVSHELRTPLSSVLGFTELMLTKELKPERQKKYLTTIYQEAKRLTALINDFLDVQRMESGKQTYDKKYEDLVSIIENVIDTQKVNTTIHQFHVRKETDKTTVLGDRDKLAQVFTNLISNAIKYSPEGGNITVRIYERGNRLCVDVQDEGLGIPEEAIPNLFKKFYRVDNSDRRRIGGTGLGLAIVKEIVKAHEGEVTVTSELKKGSTFTVSLPLVTLARGGDDERETDEKQARAHVIIVEDDENLAALLEAELKDSGFRVKLVKEGKKAIELIQKEKPDAVVLDIMLEEHDASGWDVLKALKQNEELAHIPIIISSALEEREKGMALGANSYLVKPYQPSQLSKTILQMLLNKERQGEIFVPLNEEAN